MKTENITMKDCPEPQIPKVTNSMQTYTHLTIEKKYHELQEARNRCLQWGYSVLCRRLPDAKRAIHPLLKLQHEVHVWAAEVKDAVTPSKRGASPRLLLTPSPRYTIDMDTIIQQMRQFHQSPTTAALRELISRKSLLDIWGVGRRENGHSNFLAWLLNPVESHDFRAFCLAKVTASVGRVPTHTGAAIAGDSAACHPVRQKNHQHSATLI